MNTIEHPKAREARENSAIRAFLNIMFMHLE